MDPRRLNQNNDCGRPTWLAGFGLQHDHLYVHGTGEFGFDPTNEVYAAAFWRWAGDRPDVQWIFKCGEEGAGATPVFHVHPWQEVVRSEAGAESGLAHTTFNRGGASQHRHAPLA